MANPVHHSVAENTRAKPSPTYTVDQKMDRLQGLLAVARLQVKTNELKKIKMPQSPPREEAVPLPLKKTRRILLQEAGTPTGEPFKRSTTLPNMEDAAAVPSTKPLKSCLKRSSTLPPAASHDDLLSSAKNAERPRRGSSKENRRFRRRDRRRQWSHPEAQQPKGILKRSSTDPAIALKALKENNIPKRVSFSDLSRWNSQGSGLDLKKLTSQQEKTAPRGNYVWDKTTGKTPSSCTLNLSVLTKEVGKYQAPFKPSRRNSGENLRRMQSAATKKKSTGNMFQASLNDFQKAVVTCETRRAPTKPGRRPSLEVATPEQRDSCSD